MLALSRPLMYINQHRKEHLSYLILIKTDTGMNRPVWTEAKK